MGKKDWQNAMAETMEYRKHNCGGRVGILVLEKISLAVVCYDATLIPQHLYRIILSWPLRAALPGLSMKYFLIGLSWET